MVSVLHSSLQSVKGCPAYEEYNVGDYEDKGQNDQLKFGEGGSYSYY